MFEQALGLVFVERLCGDGPFTYIVEVAVVHSEQRYFAVFGFDVVAYGVAGVAFHSVLLPRNVIPRLAGTMLAMTVFKTIVALLFLIVLAGLALAFYLAAVGRL